MPHTPRPVSKALRKILRVAARPMKSDKGRGGIVVNAYRGYGSQTEVFVMGRVFRQLRIGIPAPEGTLYRDIVDVFRRAMRWGAKHVEVTLDLEGNREKVTTDRDGYFDVHMKIEKPLPAERIWHQGKLDIVMRDARTVSGEVEVYIPPSAVDLVVISDIDDTVMYTGVANKLKMMYRLFFEKAHQRTAFPGVADFYQALFAGADGQRRRPLLYVSRGPWSIYEVLEEFFQRNRIPVGPILFLREWGLTLQRPLPRKAEDHKLSLITQMLTLYDELPFVLIGDSGQHDPETYARIVRDYPGRIRAIYIRNVHHDASRDEAIEYLAREVEEDGCSLLLAADSVSMAEHAHELGLISTAGLQAVRQAPDEA
ncbi:Phosphatidate phosphatase APP1 [Modicisalibacter ilicicola DSM 19980]|uniref:Phosphatidate phosphatase APP1 n=1 Tax=Modicisalibacter ilicicola DSM 19980 TaxID=1121942 RepID=A0A1M5B754_9GAMM|nr:phosphatase domain-containing protein [Halomonas ilicicola]SHF38285.1 Phosphatidate phosphatase APP1 [Halomonas ilicicola DSM 19980]